MQNGQITNATNVTKRVSLKRASASPADSEDTVLGLVPDVMDMDYLADINAGVVRAPVGGFPSSYDLRTQGRLTDVRDQNPYGTCALTQSGTVPEPGFTTIPLSSAIPVISGSRFSVVLKLTTLGYAYPHAIEYAYTGITSGATASSGQSFYSSNGSLLTDLTSWNSTANLCIKAYTASAVVTPQEC